MGRLFVLNNILLYEYEAPVPSRLINALADLNHLCFVKEDPPNNLASSPLLKLNTIVLGNCSVQDFLARAETMATMLAIPIPASVTPWEASAESKWDEMSKASDLVPLILNTILFDS